MAFQKGIIGTAIAVGIAFMLSAPLTASAQGGGGQQPAAGQAGREPGGAPACSGMDRVARRADQEPGDGAGAAMIAAGLWLPLFAGNALNQVAEVEAGGLKAHPGRPRFQPDAVWSFLNGI